MRIVLSVVLFFSCVSKENQISSSKGIISTAPNITEIIRTLGEQDKILAVSNYCQSGVEICSKPKIGSSIDLDIEKVVQLDPEFVLLTHSKMTRKSDTKLAKFKIKSKKFKFDRLADIIDSTKEISILLNKQEEFEAINEKIKNILKSTPKLLDNKKLLLLFGHHIDKGKFKSLSAVGAETYLDDTLTPLGAQNIFMDSSNPYPIVNPEALFFKNPDAVIHIYQSTDNQNDLIKLKNTWKKYSNLTSVKNNNVYLIKDNHFLIPGPHIYKFLEKVKNILERKDDCCSL